MIDAYVPGLALDFYLYPLNFLELYPEAASFEDLLDFFSEDLQALANEIQEFPGVISVAGGVYVERTDGEGSVHLLGELTIKEEPGFHYETFGAKLDLLTQGFVYHAAEAKFVAAGEVNWF